ncbi:uncharacterized protein LOC143616831 [Bidens hawaiensis]|uniref:uncharacterized protein LOC143616831 n=1 Tax=Bidens hawaiensis TaxID=980011 RepID=UPI00404A7514
MFPDEFKFAFKIDISQYNLDYSKWVFGVSKLSDDKDIIFELEKKANIELDTSGSLTNGFTDTQSQEIGLTDTHSQDTANLNVDNLDDLTFGINAAVESNKTINLKAISEIMDDNVIPLPRISNDKCMEKMHVSEAATFKRKSKNSDFKKNLADSLDLEEIGELSTSKPVSHDKPILLIPKLEK